MALKSDQPIQGSGITRCCDFGESSGVPVA